MPVPSQVVNTEMDLPDANVGDGIPLTASGFVSLRAVVQEVNATGTPNTVYTVEFANVVGQQFQSITGVIVTPNAQTEMTARLASQLPALAANRQYLVLGSTTRRVAIARDPNAAAGTYFRYVEVSPFAELYVNGLRIGGADNRTGTGGAILNHANGTLVVANCYFGGNVAQAGGAIANMGSLAFEPWIATNNKTEFASNTAPQGGGAIYMGGNGVVVATADVRDVQFVDNVAGTLPEDGRRATNKGGAIATNATGRLTVTGCDFTNNRAMEGGAIYADGVWTALPSVTVNSSRFLNNQAGEPGSPNLLGGLGGAVYIHLLNVEFVGCEFRNNKSDKDGGAFFVLEGKLTLDTCLFVGNVADGPKLSHDIAEDPPAGVMTMVFLINTVATVVNVE